MSKNHPNDNIYSILGKLEALKPTPEEKRFALVKEIRESVEAQGSILEGVDAIEAKLAQQFAESQVNEKAVSKAQQKFMGMVHAAQKGEKAASPEVAKVAKSMGKKDAKDFASTKHKGLPQHIESECAMCEAGDCAEHMAEGDVTRTPGKTVHTKTDYPGYPADVGFDDEEPKGRGRPRIHAKKEPTGLGRGRPKKNSADKSMAHLPWGGNPPKDTWKPSPTGRVHRISEGRYLEDSAGESFNHILNRFRTEVRNFEQGGDLDNDLYDALYDYYVDCGEMPYGVQKARTGDPMRWVAEKLDVELGNLAYGSDPANAEAMEGGIPGNLPPEQIPGKEDLLKGKGRSYYEESSLEEELNELARLAGLSEEARGAWLKTKADGASTVDAFGQKDIPVPGNKGKSEVDEEESPKADKDYDQDGKVESEKDEVIGSRRKAAGLDESVDQFGNAADSEFNINTSMSSDGNKNVTVTATGEHAAELLQMLRIAGLGGGDTAQSLQAQEPCCDEPELVADEGNEFSGALAQARSQHADSFEVGGHEYPVDEDNVDVAEPATEPANSPEPEYSSMRGSTMGPGEGDAGEKAMNPDRPTKNNGDNALSNPPTRAQKVLKAVAALESKLAEEYESIKKFN